MKHLDMHQPYYLQTLGLRPGETRVEEGGDERGAMCVCAANIRFRRIVLTSNIVKLKFGNSKGNIGELLNTTSEHTAGPVLEGLEN